MEIWEYDESIFKSDEQQAQERKEAEAQEYALHERVQQGNSYGVIVEIMTTNGNESYLVEDERTGFKHWYGKRLISKVEQAAPQEKMTFNGPYKVGVEIEYHGHTYRVIEVGEVSEADAVNADDINDVQIPIGPYAVARLQ